MGFVFHPLDAGAVALRKYAQRLANTLPGQRGVANRIQDGYLLRAVGDGSTVTVTVIPLPTVIGGAFNAALRVGVYPGTTTPEFKTVVFSTYVSGALKESVLGGKNTELSYSGEYRTYVGSGRKLIGTVTQEWPMSAIGSLADGWQLSPPEYTVQGQCRLGASGSSQEAPWATKAVPCRTALLTLHTPRYKVTHGVPGFNDAQGENAVSLFRLTAGTRMLPLNALGDAPPAIKTDTQADYRVRADMTAGCGLIEFSTDALGISHTPTDTGEIFSTDGELEAIGCLEWGPTDGVVAVGVHDRGYRFRVSVARYNTAELGTIVWQTDLEAPFMPPDGNLRTYSVAESCARYGAWATRAGRGLSNGSPDQPDEIIVFVLEETGYNISLPYAKEPEYVYGVFTLTWRMYRIDVATGSKTGTTFDSFDANQYNLTGPLVYYDYAHALGLTVGVGAAEVPIFVCCRRAVPYTIVDVLEDSIQTAHQERIPVAKNRTAANEVDIIALSATGATTVLDIGDNYPLYYFTSSSSNDGRLLGWCDFAFQPSYNTYDPPVCEFAPGYVAILVSSNSTFLSVTSYPRIVICDVVTGAKVYESATTPLPTLGVSEYAAISCAKHGQVVDGVASGGILLVTIYKTPYLGSPNAQTGCYATRDLGVTYNQVLGYGVSEFATCAMHYLGSPLKPAIIGGGQ